MVWILPNSKTVDFSSFLLPKPRSLRRTEKPGCLQPIASRNILGKRFLIADHLDKHRGWPPSKSYRFSNRHVQRPSVLRDGSPCVAPTHRQGVVVPQTWRYRPSGSSGLRSQGSWARRTPWRHARHGVGDGSGPPTPWDPFRQYGPQSISDYRRCAP